MPLADVHYGHVQDKAEQRSVTLATARAANPTRFTTNHDPKTLNPPETAWINQPGQEKHAA